MTNRPGLILLELVLALGISLLALMAVVQVTTKSITLAGFSRSRSEATTYAVAAMEWLRQQKKQLGWTAFSALAGQTYCLNDLPPTWPSAGPCASGSVVDNTLYQRQAILTNLSGQIEAVVTVGWQEAVAGTVQTFSSRQTTVFTRY